MILIDCTCVQLITWLWKEWIIYIWSDLPLSSEGKERKRNASLVKKDEHLPKVLQRAIWRHKIIFYESPVFISMMVFPHFQKGAFKKYQPDGAGRLYSDATKHERWGPRSLLLQRCKRWQKTSDSLLQCYSEVLDKRRS